MARKRQTKAKSGAAGAGALTIAYRPVAALTLDAKNPRKHSKAQIRQIAASIEAFGFNTPILADAADKIIAGHGRVMAAKLLKMEAVPVVRLEHLSEAQARAFMIADNRLTENSVWDEEILALTFKELSLQDLTFDLEATGFEMGEIDFRIETLSPANENANQETERLEDLAPAKGPPTTQTGDLWILGKHKIFCGDALQDTSYHAVLGARRAQMVFTDPPYNVKIVGHVSGLGAVKHREFAMAAGEMSETEFTQFLTTLCKLLAAHSKAGSLHYLFMDWRHLYELLSAGRSVYGELKNLCVWAKTNAGMGSLYRSQHELIAVFKSGKSKHQNNVALGKFGRNRSNLWTYPGMTSITRSTEEGALLELHPTVKPVRLAADAILDASSRGGLILDPFLGSGSTLIAAHRVGRSCAGIELDPAYVDVAIRRFQSDTGEPAILARTGETFHTIEAARAKSRRKARKYG